MYASPGFGVVVKKKKILPPIIIQSLLYLSLNAVHSFGLKIDWYILIEYAIHSYLLKSENAWDIRFTVIIIQKYKKCSIYTFYVFYWIIP